MPSMPRFQKPATPKPVAGAEPGVPPPELSFAVLKFPEFAVLAAPVGVVLKADPQKRTGHHFVRNQEV